MIYFKTTYESNKKEKSTKTEKQTVSENDLNLLKFLLNKHKEYTKIPVNIINKNFITYTVNKFDNLNVTDIALLKTLHNNIKTFLNNNPNLDSKYTEFKIPKRKGGYRHLVNPDDDLKYMQRLVLEFLQNTQHILPHNSAHAFVKNRDAYTNAITHVKNKCFITIDLKDFFTSINKDILTDNLKTNSRIAALDNNSPNFINDIITLALYKGSLPQGSPLSPFLSNLVMTKFDYTIQKQMSNKALPRYTYTRYADDMCFSAPVFSHIKTFLNNIESLLTELYNGNIKIKKEKTKILRNTNRCYITGIKLNKDFQATYGHENKKALKLQLFNLFQADVNKTLVKEEVQETLGKFSYLSRIEPDYARYLEKKLLNQFESKQQTLAKHFKKYL